MPKKKKNKPETYRFETMSGSCAIEKVSPEESSSQPNEKSEKITTIKFLAQFKLQIQNVPNDNYPHNNRTLAFIHSLCDTVTRKATEKLEKKQISPTCDAGCDACCYFTDMDATGLEFEEIIHYIKNKMPVEVREKFKKQIQTDPDFSMHEHTPCPFLDRSNGFCGVYLVRPMGCRGLLATKPCKLEKLEDTGFQMTVQLIAESWKEMPIYAGTLMSAQEYHRRGRGHFRPTQCKPDILVKFKKLEPDRLLKLFSNN